MDLVTPKEDTVQNIAEEMINMRRVIKPMFFSKFNEC